MSGSSPLAAAIDLGTSIVKGALLRADGSLELLSRRPAPELSGDGLARESSLRDYLGRALAVLSELSAAAGKRIPLGIASQRSTFALCERGSGAPITPLVSWQDRRAEAWCAAHTEGAASIEKLTGLRLSPHYVGPKLAVLLETDPSLRARLEDGEAIFGTLDTLLIRRLSGGAAHETDPTMAARTLLADPRAGDWSQEMLDLFGIPAAALPLIRPTAGFEGKRGGLLDVAASVSDQAAASLSALGDRTDEALVSLGTGGFVLRMTGTEMRAPRGHLAGPVLGAQDGFTLFAAEGTINAAAEALHRFGAGSVTLPEADPSSGAFCLPDAAGAGSPHWRADLSLVLSEEARRLGPAGRRRAVLEGLLFRVREILEALFPEAPPRRVLLAGGLARERSLAEGLAACLGRSVVRLDEPEATLLGAARLAAGAPPGDPPPRGVEIDPGRCGAYLAEKWMRWRDWLREALR